MNHREIEQLQLKNKIFQRILDEIDVGVHVVNEEGRTTFYNKKMAQIEGMDYEDVLDKNLLDVFSFNQNEDSTLLQALKNGSKIKNAKQTYFNNKGQEITTINNTFPIMEDGEQIGAMEIARDVTKLEKLIRENMNKRGDTRYTFDSIIGSSDEINEVVEASKRATRTSSSVLIIGETGTGKELFAQSIHNGSSRSSKPFISQNCAALPDSLIEGLLFGTKKGAFTGSIERPGLFEQANGGTLLLDEINSLNPSLQAKLLRVLQEKTVRRVGDTKDRTVDVRIIATINEDPIDAISEDRLRKDLYYRLSVVSLFIPPLRKRRKDIRDLAQFFIEKYNQLFGMNVAEIDEEVMSKFEQYDWPGNVRELEHIIEGAMNLIDQEETISYVHLPLHFRNKPQFKEEPNETGHLEDLLIQKNKPIKSLEQYIQEAETYYLKKVLKHHGNNITQAAKSLCMSRQNLQYRLRKYGVRKENS
ncbi:MULTISPECIES: sigma-54 interaction domain-containing protein [Bacillaceae]|jgi:arginine utilization regulatory protein|uniref:Sigma-54-dependent Fis family transcriptional regulator n=1 Tax=Cytobacillus firmus TaxID=1399 RepID=A0AA46PN48_CYTFI|nr:MULTISPECIES: sigma-54-dependent Fis family transcriptional regulator [Bacillaceae]KML39085.1 ATPase AAA [Cytobacillus firmus]MBG9446961.1 ATPase AAA [Cytobacillus firmus]MCS0655831.1 sigma-54-dependent Fis family transcriptional regulator [Cytobacillus firmus]MCU1806780.1 sigma-54-dependent Fis family transcriptional regulator [Cytobacillus firmus]UYG94140.1 sigma-54-dependent Fis family transcriptional regulator [Cytobacillus firmus]